MGDDEQAQRPQYEVFLDPRASRDLIALQDNDRQRVEARIAALADNPRPPGAVKLSGREDYRVRVGDWRVIYLIDDGQRRVLVSRVKRRNEHTYG